MVILLSKDTQEKQTITNTRRDNMNDLRNLESSIINFIKDLLSSYNLTIHDVIREVSNYFAIAITRTLIDLVVDTYEKYSDKNA